MPNLNARLSQQVDFLPNLGALMQLFRVSGKENGVDDGTEFGLPNFWRSEEGYGHFGPPVPTRVD